MKYDLKIHIPQQIENLLTAENEGNLALFERSIENLVEQIDEPGFKMDLKEYNDTKNKGIEDIKKDFMEIAAEAIKTGEYEKFISMLDNAQQALSTDTLEVVKEYMNQVKTYVFSYVKKVEVKTL